MDATSSIPHPRCPRCGYDLSGHVGAWRDLCPVAGECPECGLAFAWADILRGDRWLLSGFFEHVRGWRRLPVAAARTGWWALNPTGFWTRVEMRHKVVPRRLALWPVLTLVGLQLASLVPLLSVALYDYVFAASQIIAGRSPWRVWVFPGMAPLTPVQVAAAAVGAQGQHRHAASVRALQALIEPVALWRGPWGFSAIDPFLDVWGTWAPSVRGGVIASLVIPLLVLALPVTRRRNKVRWGHVVRAGVYGMAWLLPLVFVRACLNLFEGSRAVWYKGTLVVNPPWYRRAPVVFAGWGTPQWVEPIVALLIAAWIGWWWRQALGRGLRLDAAGRAFWLVYAGGLITGVLAAFADPRMG